MSSWYLPLSSSATLGALEFSLLYDQDNSSLHCTIIKAKVGEGAKLGTAQYALVFLGAWGGRVLSGLSPVMALSICDTDSNEKGAGIGHG